MHEIVSIQNHVANNYSVLEKMKLKAVDHCANCQEVTNDQAKAVYHCANCQEVTYDHTGRSTLSS